MDIIKSEKFRNYFLYFVMYSVIGWIYEVFLEVVIYRWGFSNRGLLFGPYCPIYGVGAIVLILTVYRLIENKDRKTKLKMLIPVFLGSALIATAIELAATYICEYTIGYWPWQTYADYKINFQARIALSPSIRFGLGGVLFLYVIQPVFELIVNKMNNRKKALLFFTLLTVIIVDIIFYIIINVSHLFILSKATKIYRDLK